MKFVIFLCMLRSCFARGFFFPKYGELDQSDPYLFVGEYFNITCTLSSQSVENGDNSSKLFFSYGNDIEVQAAETTIINNASLKHSTLITTAFCRAYYCNLRNPVFIKTDPLKNVALLDSTTVDTEYPPEPVKNFSCIIYDWDEKMECSWDLGVNYRDLQFINTSLNLKLSGSCPNKNLLNCTWIKGGPYSFDRSTLFFKVSVKNTKRNVSKETDWITIKQAEYVKPNPVEMIKIVSISSKCVTLKWKHQKLKKQKKFIIRITSKWTDNKLITTKELNTTVCELKPNTKYEISIVARPEKVDYGYPSDIGDPSDIGYPSNPVIIIATTQTDFPVRPPEVFPGSYVVSVEGCRNNNRNVTLYWKDLPEKYQNGLMLGYKVTVLSEDGELSNYHVNSRTFISLPLPCRHGIRVSLFSRNVVGYSLEPSNITIPTANTLLPPSRTIVEAQNTSTDTTVSVSWTPTEDGRIEYHTVYYCQFDTECTTDIEWIRVPVNSTLLTIEHLQFDKKYRFGVSSDMDRVSSGFKWEDCYYLKSIAPSPPTQVDVLAYPENAITVDWSDPKCGVSPYIKFFKVTWCTASKGTIDCSGYHQERNISSTEPSKLVIPNLKAGTSYGVRIQHITGDGRISDYSDMVYIQPTNNNLAPSEITSIAVGGTFLLMLAIAGAVFIYKRTAHGIREIKRPLEIITPKIKLSVGNTVLPYSSQLSKDSGRSSLASDGLQSPAVDDKLDLLPVPEETTGVNSNHKSSDDHTTISCSPDYSKMALESNTFRQETVLKKVTGPPILCASPVNERRKSVKTFYSKHKRCENENVDSYIKHVDIQANVTENTMLESGSVSAHIPSVDQLEVQMSKTCGQPIRDQPYIKTETLEVTENSRVPEVEFLLSTRTNYGRDSTKNCQADDVLLPLIEPNEEDSNISMISNGYLSKDAMNNKGISLPRQQPSIHNSGSSTVEYHHLDSMENPKLLDVLTPLMRTDSANQYHSDYLKENLRDQDVIKHDIELGQEDSISNCYLKEEDIRNPGVLNSNRERDQEELNSVGYLRDIDVEILNREPVQEDLKGTNYLAENMDDWAGKGESSGGYITEGIMLNGNLIDDENVSSYVSGSKYTRKVENSIGSGYITEKHLINIEFSANDQGSASLSSEDGRFGQINSSADDSFNVANEERKSNDGYIQHNDIKT